MYLLGVFTFLFATCLELPWAIYSMMFLNVSPLSVVESINMAVVGIVAGAVSVSIGGKRDVGEKASSTIL